MPTMTQGDFDKRRIRFVPEHTSENERETIRLQREIFILSSGKWVRQDKEKIDLRQD